METAIETNQKGCDHFRRNFETYAPVSSMHGVYEIQNAKTLYGSLVWIFIVMASIALTIYQIYKAIIQYMTHTTLTLIEPLDTSLLYPPLSLCFIHWITWVNWKKAIGMNFTKESLLYGFSYLTPIFSPTVFNTTQAKISLLETMKSNDISTISELYKRIAKPVPMVMGLYDKARLVDDPPFLNDIEFQMKGSDLYLCYRINGDDILRVLAGNGSGSSLSILDNSVFNFSNQHFKYQFISKYMSEDEYSFNVGYWLLVKTNYWLLSLSDFLQNFTTFSFSYRVYPDSYSDKYVEISTEFDSFSIEMTPTVHRWMNKETEPCVIKQQAISSETSCLDKCQAYRRNDLNLCLPLDTADLLGLAIPERLCQNQIYFIPRLFQVYRNIKGSISDLFNVSDPYNAGLPKSIDNNTFSKVEAKYEACKNACVPACEIWNYEFTSSAAVQPTSVRALSFVNQTDVNIIYPGVKSVLIVVEETGQTWEDFIANVGGLLGVWTGASLLSFIQVVYFCCFYDTSFGCFADAFYCLIRCVKRLIKHDGSASRTPVTNLNPGTHQDSPV